MLTIAFDLGNVVFNVNDDKFNEFFERYHLTRSNVETLMKPYINLNHCGLVKIKDVLLKEFNLPEKMLPEALKAWSDGVSPSKAMVNFIQNIKSDVSIAFLSNIGPEHLKDLTAAYPHIMELSDVNWMSCEVGAAKPSLLYYQSFLNMYPGYKGCVYLDDREENIIASKKLGFNAIQFDLEKFSNEEELDNKLMKIKKEIYG